MTPNAPWTATESQTFEFAQLQTIADTENANAMQAYLGALNSAAQMGKPMSSVAPAIVVGVVPNTDPNTPGFYTIAQASTFTMPQPPSQPVSTNPVGNLNPNTTVYNAVLPAAESYNNGDTFTDSRGTFRLTAQVTPWGTSRWWTPVTPAAS